MLTGRWLAVEWRELKCGVTSEEDGNAQINSTTVKTLLVLYLLYGEYLYRSGPGADTLYNLTNGRAVFFCCWIRCPMGDEERSGGPFSRRGGRCFPVQAVALGAAAGDSTWLPPDLKAAETRS